MADSDEWTSDANKAVSISLVQPGPEAPKAIAAFHPTFTYPIFGEAQTIYGYQRLLIDIRFACHDLRPSLRVSWKEKQATIGETSALDVKETLERWLPPTAFEAPAKFDNHVQQDSQARSFKPPGELLTTYQIKDRTFEVWRASLMDLAVQQLLKRMQIFIPFFIEGGTYIDLDDPEWTLQRWRIFFLYERLSRPSTPTGSYYSIVGYCTVYRYFLFTPAPKPSERESLGSSLMNSKTPFPFPLDSPLPPTSLPCRERISQFLILPPYQHRGHGSAFYNALINSFLSDPTIREITVEDPNEAFDDLRDYCDLSRLRNYPVFTKTLRINTSSTSAGPQGRLATSIILPMPTLAALRTETKLAPRQFARLVEMQLLSLMSSKYTQASRLDRRKFGRSKSSSPDERTYHLWRLIVKQRLYKRNRDQLAQLDRKERLEKLEQVLADQEEDYLRLLAAFDKDSSSSSTHEDHDHPKKQTSDAGSAQAQAQKQKQKKQGATTEHEADDEEMTVTWRLDDTNKDIDQDEHERSKKKQRT